MFNFWLFSDLILLATILISLYFFVKSFLSFINASLAVLSYYNLSPHADTNMRAEMQMNTLSAYLEVRERSGRLCILSTAVACVMVFLKVALGVIHAVL